MTFTLDTSGAVDFGPHPEIELPAPFTFTRYVGWEDLDPFTQGFVEAAFASFNKDRPHGLRIYSTKSRAGHWRTTVKGVFGETVFQSEKRSTRHGARYEADQFVKARGFSDLAPETLARFMEDCAGLARDRPRMASGPNAKEFGAECWRRDIMGEQYATRLYLNDEGRVCVREAGH